MLRVLKNVCCLLVLGMSVASAPGFSLIGPREDWQEPNMGYGTGPFGPMNLGEEWRRNVPIMYYAFDQNFLEFFGSNGVRAVEQAFAVLNNLTNVSAYSPDLNEFPLEAQAINYEAEALSLIDLKSLTLASLMYQLGLNTPVNWVWTVRDREDLFGCPEGMLYNIVQRNYGIQPSALNEIQYSSYVNGTLYSYFILEFCSVPAGFIIRTDAVEFPVDPLARTFTAVADGVVFSRVPGFLYTGLTRDDVAGLRYLYRTNNMNIESIGPGAVQLVTNTSPTFLTTLDLGLFSQQALTNDATTMSNLYPGLVITSTSNFVGRVITTNVTFIFRPPPPTAPAGTLPRVAAVTNFTTNFSIMFSHRFANVVTNSSSSGGFVFVEQVYFTNSPFAPAGSPPTLVTNSFVRFDPRLTSGDFFVLPDGVCAAAFVTDDVFPEFPNGVPVVTTTTTVTIATNTAGLTNAFFQQSVTTFATNHILVYLPVDCVPDTVALRQGVNRIRFVRRDYDSLLGQFFHPITNEYVLNAITNNSVQPQRIRRVVVEPDFLFTAADLNLDPDDDFFNGITLSNIIQLDARFVLPNLAGPGQIISPNAPDSHNVIAFNKSTPLYVNPGLLIISNPPAFLLTEVDHVTTLAYGSYDASTNTPIVYPNGMSITNMENMVLLPVVTASVPAGDVGEPYNAQLTGQGGQPPYVWSLAPGSGPLPPGLTLTPGGVISGTPTTGGSYTFTIRLVDSFARVADASLTITVF